MFRFIYFLYLILKTIRVLHQIPSQATCELHLKINLESVNELTTSSFTTELKCIMSMWCKCTVYCDSATNFPAANSKLHSKHRTQVPRTTAEQGTMWHFMPPRLVVCGSPVWKSWNDISEDWRGSSVQQHWGKSSSTWYCSISAESQGTLLHSSQQATRLCNSSDVTHQ
jgi:hypothetical protein